MSNWCLIKIKGGLGNQIFQFALARFIETELGWRVIYDLSEYNEKSLRKLELCKLGASFTTSFKSKLVSKTVWLYFSLFRKRDYLKESKLGCITNRGLVKNYIAFNGYWQTSLFSEYAREALTGIVRSDLIEQFQDEIAVHVRRGDYTSKKNQEIHGLCSDNYYLSATRLMRNKGFSKFRVYSDDLEYCKKLFEGEEGFNFGPLLAFGDDVDEFTELANHTSGLIISNSSFSWWAAVLTASPNIIFPSKWFVDEAKNEESKRLRVKHWIALS